MVRAQHCATAGLAAMLLAGGCDKDEPFAPVEAGQHDAADAPADALAIDERTTAIDAAGLDTEVVDAPAFVDVSPDPRFEPAFGTFGGPCNTDSDCPGGLCVNETRPSSFGSYPGGLCSVRCRLLADPDAGHSPECPIGFHCGRLAAFGTDSAMGTCLQSCLPGTPVCERRGWGCSSRVRHCVAGCDDSGDCPAGLDCAPLAGEAGQCFSPGASVGSPCTNHQQCAADGDCRDEALLGWPGGSCVQRCAPGAADARSLGNCAGDNHCLSVEDLPERCLDGCTNDADCRPGYRCQDPGDRFAGQLYCAPFCTSDDHCTGSRLCDRASGKCR